LETNAYSFYPVSDAAETLVAVELLGETAPVGFIADFTSPNQCGTTTALLITV